ncbi:MAG: hypothetical protein K0Q55_2086 [Verrucomicrobia bacterium]|nr:hypothetical protein [Verrucomicrobiota bacterium]
MALAPAQRPAWRAWLPLLLLYAALHYLLLLILDSVVFLFAHFPPQLIDLSPVVIAITYLQQALNLPRILLRYVWLSEVTPGWLNLLLTIVNSLVFGALWFAWRKWQQRPL